MGIKNMTIVDGYVSNATINYAFNVQLHSGENPQISPIIDFEYMPVDVLVKLAYDALKVKGRPYMKSMTVQDLKQTYKGKVSWRTMYSKDGAESQKLESSMGKEELTRRIAELQKMQDEMKDDFDTEVEKLKG
jgi:hypothetical protein